MRLFRGLTLRLRFSSVRESEVRLELELLDCAPGNGTHGFSLSIVGSSTAEFSPAPPLQHLYGSPLSASSTCWFSGSPVSHLSLYWVNKTMGSSWYLCALVPEVSTNAGISYQLVDFQVPTGQSSIQREPVSGWIESRMPIFFLPPGRVGSSPSSNGELSSVRSSSQNHDGNYPSSLFPRASWA